MTLVIGSWSRAFPITFLIMSCRVVPLYLGRNAFSTHFTKVSVSSHSAHFFIFSNQPDMRKNLHQLWDSLTFQNSHRIKRLKDKLLLKLLIYRVGSARIHYSCFGWFAREDMRTLFKIKCFDFICFKGLFSPFGVVSIAVTRPPVLVPATTSK